MADIIKMGFSGKFNLFSKFSLSRITFSTWIVVYALDVSLLFLILANILSIKIVKDEEEAIQHIQNYGSGHSEAIITQNYSASEKFLNEIDAACVYVNASTRFTDGGEFGFGAEVGISTNKLHARGPMGINDLTTYKFKIYGEGQIR